MNTLIVIPARYGSTRFPGKPLAEIAGQSMLSRVVRIAQHAAQGRENVEIVVATDDDRIQQHCEAIQVNCVMTPADCHTGSDRAVAALKQQAVAPDVVINLQGDVPLLPPPFLSALLDVMAADPSIPVATPVVPLRWEELDRFRQQKTETPFSGTCAIVNAQGHALWFSKQVIPAIRKEEALRALGPVSPVLRHVGLYAYSRQALEQFVQWESSQYEQLEGLEQLRFLENGYTIRCVEMKTAEFPLMSGVDSPGDVKRAEALIAAHGELFA